MPEDVAPRCALFPAMDRFTRRIVYWSVAIARGSHPFPFRTRKLSPAARMVLPGGPGGRVRRRRPLAVQQPPGMPRGAVVVVCQACPVSGVGVSNGRR